MERFPGVGVVWCQTFKGVVVEGFPGVGVVWCQTL